MRLTRAERRRIRAMLTATNPLYTSPKAQVVKLRERGICEIDRMYGS